jgi:hypothetical protein
MPLLEQVLLIRFTASTTRQVQVLGSACGASHQPALVVENHRPPSFFPTLSFQQSHAGEFFSQSRLPMVCVLFWRPTEALQSNGVCGLKPQLQR